MSATLAFASILFGIAPTDSPDAKGAGAAEVFVVDTRGSAGRAPDTLYRAPIADFFQQTLVGATNPRVSGIDFSPDTTVLHAAVSTTASANPGTFGSINPATGGYTPIGPLALIEGDVGGLAVDPRSGVVFLAGTTGSRSLLYTVNPTTGAAAPINLIANQGADTDIGALAIDCEGHLFGLDRAA